MKENQLIETKKKSAFIAKSEYDYKKLTFTRPYLIDMTLEDEKEDLIFHYNIKDLKSLMEIRKEDILTILAVLINIADLKNALEEYNFSIEPDNLYFNRDRQILVKERDTYIVGKGFEENEFLDNYKALIGFAMQNKYTYEDFKKGGKKLLSKNQFQNQIREACDVESVKTLLINEYERIENDRRANKQLINRKNVTGMKIAIGILGFLCVTLIGYLSYQMIVVNPYNEAVIKADNAYIAQDYVSCIDYMSDISVERMQGTQKYILANSYVRSENLTQEQKNNILANISLKETAARLEYWSYLGRGDTDKAIDIAMQQSDDELLLYAYMKKKSYIEADTDLTGEEKTQQLKNISTLMEPLIDQYNTEEK